MKAPQNRLNLSYEDLKELKSPFKRLKYRNYIAQIEIEQINFISIKKENIQIKHPHPDFKNFFEDHNDYGRPNYQAKFHISIREEYITEGWNLVKDILIRHAVNHFKVIKPGIKLSEYSDAELDQCGKEVTIYLFSNPEKGVQDWAGIIKIIIETLIQNDIPAGYETSKEGKRADKGIPAIPQYISYRYENSPNLILMGDPLSEMSIEINSAILQKYYENSSLHCIKERPWGTQEEVEMSTTETRIPPSGSLADNSFGLYEGSMIFPVDSDAYKSDEKKESSSLTSSSDGDGNETSNAILNVPNLDLSSLT